MTKKVDLEEAKRRLGKILKEYKPPLTDSDIEEITGKAFG